jgi:hypothetical protein
MAQSSDSFSGQWLRQWPFTLDVVSKSFAGRVDWTISAVMPSGIITTNLSLRRIFGCPRLSELRPEEVRIGSVAPPMLGGD